MELFIAPEDFTSSINDSEAIRNLLKNYDDSKAVRTCLDCYVMVMKNTEALLEPAVANEIAELEAWATRIIDKVCAGRSLYIAKLADAWIKYAENKREVWFKDDLRESILNRDFSSAFERRTYIFSKIKQVTKEILCLQFYSTFCKNTFYKYGSASARIFDL